MTHFIPDKLDELKETAAALVAPGKGILAMDESNATCCKRFEAQGIECTEESRRQYRELLLTTQGLEEYVSGAILYDETIRQSAEDGRAFVAVMQSRGQLPGIKVDTGAKPLAGTQGEKVTEGLDGLRERVAEYYALGARFAKWRAVIAIGDGIPSAQCLEANAHALARYAALCQEGGLVPIVEPEVLIDGDHSIDQCEAVTEQTLHTVFDQLYRQNVAFEATILKASMVIPGKSAAARSAAAEVAQRTVQTLRRTVPASLPGVVFLSGGQSNEEATAHLNAMNRKFRGQVPWPLSFSYARALQQPALDIWQGQPGNVERAQKALFERARLNSLAVLGDYSPEMEQQAA